MKVTSRERHLLKKEWDQMAKKERLLLHQVSFKEKETRFGTLIRSKIPPKALSALETAFEKGFLLLFNKGDGFIEKSGSLSRVRATYDDHEDSLYRMIHTSTLKSIDKSAKNISWSNKGFSTVEGTVLGIFGIGLPDIPLFLAMLLKNIYEIAACYGIDYRRPEEKKYTLELLKVVFSKGEDQRAYSLLCNEIGNKIDQGQAHDMDLGPEDISYVSRVLAGNMLVAKFVQGMTFVGILGGPLNLHLMHKVSKIARLKYKKRFLYRLLNQE